jgi:hypothetical protein
VLAVVVVVVVVVVGGDAIIIAAVTRVIVVRVCRQELREMEASEVRARQTQPPSR